MRIHPSIRLPSLSEHGHHCGILFELFARLLSHHFVARTFAGSAIPDVQFISSTPPIGGTGKKGIWIFTHMKYDRIYIIIIWLYFGMNMLTKLEMSDMLQYYQFARRKTSDNPSGVWEGLIMTRCG
jgi:hypothetical protein